MFLTSFGNFLTRKPIQIIVDVKFHYSVNLYFSSKYLSYNAKNWKHFIAEIRNEIFNR